MDLSEPRTGSPANRNLTDIAHVLLGLAQGLAAQETAGWLATSQASADRRWSLAFQATLGGLAAP